ncbi:MAG: hypothetical protein K2I43_04965, partial [Alistipes sp.]|nr:hypothetical protein [Alistipes sp.]
SASSMWNFAHSGCRKCSLRAGGCHGVRNLSNTDYTGRAATHSNQYDPVCDARRRNVDFIQSGLGRIAIASEKIHNTDHLRSSFRPGSNGRHGVPQRQIVCSKPTNQLFSIRGFAKFMTCF